MLLALYTFIATPVEHWHHHASAASGADLTTVPKGKVIHAGKEHCRICTHQYSVYEESCLFHWQHRPLFLGMITCFYKREITLAFTLTCSNKGPPLPHLV